MTGVRRLLSSREIRSRLRGRTLPLRWFLVVAVLSAVVAASMGLQREDS